MTSNADHAVTEAKCAAIKKKGIWVLEIKVNVWSVLQTTVQYSLKDE
jgi:hypothetical protein